MREGGTVRATWLADAFRTAGLNVYEMPGWVTRETRPGFSPRAVICHHTATGPNWDDDQVAFLLRDGRRDLAGPLAQIGLERDGTVVLVAAGRCNHNGFGLHGNDSFGIEAYNDGRGEHWPAVQLDAYERVVKVLCDHHGWGPDQVLAHRESDPDRKIDPTGIDMDDFRADVFAGPAPTPPPIEDDDDMFTYEFTKDGVKHLRVVEGNHQTALTGQALHRQREGKANHLADVGLDEVARFDARYGPAT
jgi:hypothetical protein